MDFKRLNLPSLNPVHSSLPAIDRVLASMRTIMSRIPSTPPEILPLSLKDSERPLWSVMIPVYNCSEFLVYTLTSVLAEGIPIGQMQIEVVDDASTDADVKALVEQIGKGRVKYHRQPDNVGSLRNFETCLNRAQGKWVHILHGDDRVLEGFYGAMQGLFEDYPKAGAAFCRFQYINEHNMLCKRAPVPAMEKPGILENGLLRISEKQLIQYVTMVVKREVYEQLGSFYGLIYGEDWEMWVRIAKHYPIAYTPQILAEYRKHANSISGVKFLTGDYMQDATQLFGLIQHHVPPQHRKSVMRRARKNFALYGVSTANTLWRTHRNKSYVIANLKQSFKMHIGIYLCYKAAKVVAKMLLKRYI
ncbi:glycosyltransferase family 2 protein [Pontibacter sp. CAU 1760]